MSVEAALVEGIFALGFLGITIWAIAKGFQHLLRLQDLKTDIQMGALHDVDKKRDAYRDEPEPTPTFNDLLDEETKKEYFQEKYKTKEKKEK